MTAPPIQQQPEAVQPMQPPVKPWTPFNRLPTDTEPEIAKVRRIRLARLIDSAKFESWPPEWQQVATMEYEEMRQIEAAAAQPQPVPGQQQPGQQKPQPGGPNGQPASA